MIIEEKKTVLSPQNIRLQGVPYDTSRFFLRPPERGSLRIPSPRMFNPSEVKQDFEILNGLDTVRKKPGQYTTKDDGEVDQSLKKTLQDTQSLLDSVDKYVDRRLAENPCRLMPARPGDMLRPKDNSCRRYFPQL